MQSQPHTVHKRWSFFSPSPSRCTSPCLRCPEDGCHQPKVCQGQLRSAQTGRTASSETDESGSAYGSSVESTGGWLKDVIITGLSQRISLIYSFCKKKLCQLYLFIPLPHLPQVINVELWLHIFFSVESYERDLKEQTRSNWFFQTKSDFATFLKTHTVNVIV